MFQKEGEIFFKYDNVDKKYKVRFLRDHSVLQTVISVQFTGWSIPSTSAEGIPEHRHWHRHRKQNSWTSGPWSHTEPPWLARSWSSGAERGCAPWGSSLRESQPAALKLDWQHRLGNQSLGTPAENKNNIDNKFTAIYNKGDLCTYQTSRPSFWKITSLINIFQATTSLDMLMIDAQWKYY